MDPELRNALDRLAEDLRGEIRSGDVETRVYVDGAIQFAAAETRAYIDGAIQSSATETRAYIDGAIQSSATETRAYIDGAIQSSATETRAYVDGAIQSSATETRAYVDERIGTSAVETRRHFDVVGESLRADIRSLAGLMAMANERTDRRIDEQARRSGGLEGRVLGLEARVSILEDDRKPRRPRRRQ